MKNKGILLASAVAFLATACSSDTTENNDIVKVASVTYTLDKDNSTLSWKGMMSPEYFHLGTVEFSEGSLTMEGDKVTAGTFVVDMSTIENTDIEDEGKAEGLVRHLKGLDDNDHHKPADFFNIQKFPNVEVTLGNYKDGKLSTTLNILGQSLTQDVVVAISTNDAGASIQGTFEMDFTSLNIPGLQKDPESGEGLSPNIEFALNLAVKK